MRRRFANTKDLCLYDFDHQLNGIDTLAPWPGVGNWAERHIDRRFRDFFPFGVVLLKNLVQKILLKI